MKPSSFEYFEANTISEAVDVLSGPEDARVLAGGQSLVPLMNLRLARPELLVDVNGIPELEMFKVDGSGGNVRFGSNCRHRFLETAPEVAEVAPLVAESAALVGHVHIRNRATFGGSLAHADPAAELPAMMVVLQGQVEVTGEGGTRTIAAKDLFDGPFMTTLADGELLTAIEVPRAAAGDGTAFSEFALRHGDFAVVGVAAWVHLDDNGTCRGARLAGCGLGPTPVDLSSTVTGLLGEDSLGDSVLTEVAAEITMTIDPPEDVHGSKEYRRDLTKSVAIDALRRAWARAGDRS